MEAVLLGGDDRIARRELRQLALRRQQQDGPLNSFRLRPPTVLWAQSLPPAAGGCAAASETDRLGHVRRLRIDAPREQPASMRVQPLQHMRSIPPEGHAMSAVKLSGAWSAQAGTAVGCNNHRNYHNNPR